MSQTPDPINTRQATAGLSKSRQAFLRAEPSIQELIRAALHVEREVRHMKHRSEIHKTLLERVKEAVK